MEIAQIVIFLVVILLTVLAARRYNILNGFITFFGLCTTLLFVSYLRAEYSWAASIIPAQYNESIMWIQHMYQPIIKTLEICRLDFIADLGSINHYIIIIGVMLVSWILSVIIRIARKTRLKKLLSVRETVRVVRKDELKSEKDA
ncbi:MAG: hypothetical protein ACRC5M_03760 [Anaeroplasmataceae bacterium]